MMLLIVMYILKFDRIQMLNTNKDTDTFDCDDIFPANFPNIFVQYHLGEMRTTDIKWKNWNNVPLRLWQTQLKFAVWYASSGCLISSEHLNYKKRSMTWSVFQFHVCYHIR